jgi:hypothetical protein
MISPSDLKQVFAKAFQDGHGCCNMSEENNHALYV